MALEIVDPGTSNIAHLASVDVQFSGTHIGGGIYLATNHNPDTNGRVREAIPQRSLNGEGEAHDATELDYIVALGADPDSYRDDIDNDGTPDVTLAGFDTSLFYGDRLASTGEFYDGPAASMLIANDPNDLSGNVTVLGYPGGGNSLNGQAGVLHQTTGTLAAGGYTQQSVGSDIGGYFTIDGAEAVGGMSGGGTFLDFDADGDGTAETYLIGTTSRTGFIDVPGPNDINFVQSTSLSPHYADLAAAIEGLSGTDARDADDFARMTLLSAQTAGSSLTTVQGQFFHEDIYGGVNADTLLGAGGDDRLFGRDGNDSLDGGTGADTLDGGSGNDVLTGGEGADWFAGTGLGDGASDVVTDFEATGGDVIDLSSHFATLDDVVAATTELADGSILITLPAGSGGGSVQVLDTTIAQLSATNVNVVCFAAGTRILTPQGAQLVETLAPGQQVVTFDGTPKILRAVNRRRLGPYELSDRPNLWPVEIAPDALGPGVPQEVLRVSPQHRILIDSPISRRMTGGTALVAAHQLLGLPGIQQPRPDAGCDYLHLVFAGHEVISANGCWSESFYPGAQALKALPDATAQEYRAIFGAGFASDWTLMRGKQARKIVERHRKNRKAVQVCAAEQDTASRREPAI